MLLLAWPAAVKEQASIPGLGSAILCKTCLAAARPAELTAVVLVLQRPALPAQMALLTLLVSVALKARLATLLIMGDMLHVCELFAQSITFHLASCWSLRMPVDGYTYERCLGIRRSLNQHLQQSLPCSLTQLLGVLLERAPGEGNAAACRSRSFHMLAAAECCVVMHTVKSLQ